MKKNIFLVFAALLIAFGINGAASADSAENGKKLFDKYCVKCHGADGSVTDYGRSLKPIPARDLRTNRLFVGPAELRIIIKYGVYGREMKGWADTLNNDEIKDVAAYLRTFKYAADAAAGRDFFKAKCAACHDKEGVSKKVFGAPDLEMSSLGETELARTIRYGRHGTMMFPKMELYSNVDVANVVAYLMSIKK